MDQKEMKEVEGLFRRPLKIMLGLVVAVMAAMFLYLFLEWSRLESAGQAEKGKEQERRGGTADHIELADDHAEEQNGLTLWYVTYYSYDSQGRLTAMDKYDSEGNLYKYEHYACDGQGNRILEQSETPGVSWETYEEVRLTYDEENRLILEQNYDSDVLSCETYLRYLPDGSISSMVQYYSEDGQKGFWYTTVFNENGDPVSEYHYDREDQVTSCSLYRYDGKGRQIYYIYYNKGDETTKPLREVFTEYGEDQTARYSYEPLGHLNSAHYARRDDKTRTELYYLAGYSGGSGGDDIYILGQEELKWNEELKFHEGIWQTYDGENRISSLNCAFDRIHSYTACWYDGGNKVRELECSVDGGICITTVKRYAYHENGTLAECREYGFSGECLEEELQDGTLVRLEYDGGMLVRLCCTDPEENVLREILFEKEAGRGGWIREWHGGME